MNNSYILTMKMSLAIVALAFSLSACAKNNSPSASSETVVKHSAPMGEDSYESYYKKFLFEPEPCTQKYPRYYKFASSSGASMLASNSKLRLTVTAYLFKDNTYRAILELLKPRPDINSYTYEILEKHEQAGRWAVENENLRLENLGVGKALTYDERRAIDLHIESNVANGLFNQSETILTGATSSYVPQDLEVQCE